MSIIRFSDNTVFEGKGITALDFDQYLVEREDGQLEWIVPDIDIYKMKDTIYIVNGNKREVLCPNTETLNHDNNQWIGEQGDKIFTCSECGAKLDITTNNNVVKAE